ncbi:MAG: protein-tyrosine-phosphatase [Planctomycetota bacterium]
MIKTALLAIAALALVAPLANAASNTTDKLYPELRAFVDARRAEFGQIPPERRELLDGLADYVKGRYEAGETSYLNFVCTHNSRRSHMSQLFAQAASAVYGIPARTYSGGTESTAFNPRAVAAIERAGFDVLKTSDDANPVYLVKLSGGSMPMPCFSKKYDGAPNPKLEFAAIMVCDEADEACPYVPGADARFAIPFVDPKISDNTPAEAATYDERAAQIAREFLYVFDRASR